MPLWPCPAHDARDWAFAKTYHLPIREVIAGGDVQKEAFVETDKGVVVNSTSPDGRFSIDGLTPVDAIPKITAWLESVGTGRKSVNYKLAGLAVCPPALLGRAVSHRMGGWRSQTPPGRTIAAALPETKDFNPSGNGESPLANLEHWLETTDPESGEPARRETNTMPQWAGSCWYYLRFHRSEKQRAGRRPWRKNSIGCRWISTLVAANMLCCILLYSRFWHKVLFDIGVV